MLSPTPLRFCVFFCQLHLLARLTSLLLALPPLLSEPLYLISLFPLAETHVAQKNSRALPHLADPRTPEAVCQLQSASGVCHAVVTRNTTRWSVRVCSLMTDTTFRLKQIIDINQATEEASEYSSTHEFTEVKVVISGDVSIAI